MWAWEWSGLGWRVGEEKPSALSGLVLGPRTGARNAASYGAPNRLEAHAKPKTSDEAEAIFSFDGDAKIGEGVREGDGKGRS